MPLGPGFIRRLSLGGGYRHQPSSDERVRSACEPLGPAVDIPSRARKVKKAVAARMDVDARIDCVEVYGRCCGGCLECTVW